MATSCCMRGWIVGGSERCRGVLTQQLFCFFVKPITTVFFLRNLMPLKLGERLGELTLPQLDLVPYLSTLLVGVRLDYFLNRSNQLGRVNLMELELIAAPTSLRTVVIKRVALTCVVPAADMPASFLTLSQGSLTSHLVARLESHAPHLRSVHLHDCAELKLAKPATLAFKEAFRRQARVCQMSGRECMFCRLLDEERGGSGG